MTTLKTVAQSMLAQAKASPDHHVKFQDSLLGWGGSLFAHMVSSDLLRPDGALILSIDPTQIPSNPTGTHFSVPVTLPSAAVDSFLHLTSTPGTVTLIDTGGRIELQLSITLGPGWQLTDSFPELKGMQITQLSITSPIFLFSTFSPGTGDYGTHGPTGLSLSGATPITAGSSRLAALAEILTLAGYHRLPSLPIQGPVTQTPGGAEVMLSAPLGHGSLDLKLVELANPRLLAGVDWPFMSGIGNSPESVLGLNAEVDLKNFSGHKVALNTTLMMPLSDSFPVVKVAILPESTFSTSLTNIGGLLGGETWDHFLSGPAHILKPMLDHFGLKSFQADISTVNMSVGAWSLNVGTLAPWPALPGKVEIESLNAHFTHVVSGTTFELTADIVLFDELEFTGSINVPDLRIAAELKGHVSFDTGTLLAKIAHEFTPGTPVSPTVLNALGTFTLLDVRFALDQPKKNLNFGLSGSWVLVGSEFDFSVTAAVTHDAGGYGVDVGGVLSVGYMQFSGEFKKTPNGTVFTARWSTETPVGLDVLATAFGFEPPDIPPDLDLALKRAELIFDVTNDYLILAAESANYGSASFIAIKSRATGWQFFFGLDIDRKISLSDIPLVGEQLSKLQSMTIDNMQALISSADLLPKQAAHIDQLIDSGYPRPPNAGLAAGIALGLDLDFGGTPKHLSLGVGAPKGQTGVDEPPPDILTNYPVSLLEDPPLIMASGAGGDDGTTWFQIQKSFGPVTIQRVGMEYANQSLFFKIDGSMATGGLSIDLIGLSIGSPLSNFEPHFDLAGLGINYQAGPLDIGGAFLNVPAKPPVSWEYAGEVVVKAESFSLSAVGSYADVSGSPSMFIFGSLDIPLGGPPYFFITGLMGGFGYNRSLRIPEQDEVFKFPLVRGLTEPDAVGGKTPNPLEVLSKLEDGTGSEKPWVTIDIGESWIAAGLQFTSFDLIEGKALAIVEFGQEFQLAIIGLASARFPEAGSKVYASIELQLEAVFKPAEGILFFSAVLTPNSFLLAPECKLTGGFAFELWFGASPHAGDFVITVGGYSQFFKPAAWYPAEPRLGFNWSLDSKITISGGSYFALTPSAIMAGGALAIVFKDGNLKAWFTAHADLIIFFKPFEFIASIGISIGVSYRLNLLFIHKTITVELGADMSLWGPPTGGSVTIHLWFISFTINFGADRSELGGPVDWDEFATMLPQPAAIVKANVTEGLLGQRKPNLDMMAFGVAPDADIWVIRPNTFVFHTQSAVPATDLFIGEADTNPAFETGAPINIRPMQRTGLTSSLRVWLTHVDSGVEIDLQADGWEIEATKSNVPKAMWGVGEAKYDESGDKALIPDQLTGIKFTAPKPKLGPTPGTIDVRQDLDYEPLAPGENPLMQNAPPSGPKAIPDPQSVGAIQWGIMSTDTSANRAELFDLLRENHWQVGQDGDLTELADHAGIYFTDPPMISEPQSSILGRGACE